MQSGTETTEQDPVKEAHRKIRNTVKILLKKFDKDKSGLIEKGECRILL